MKSKWKIWVIVAGLMLAVIVQGYRLNEEKEEAKRRYEKEVQQGIAKEVLRFHVIANSDTKKDQELKMQVKTGLLEYMNGFLASADGLEETREAVLKNLTEIKEKASQIVAKNGSNDRVDAKVEKCEFPEKTYGNCTFPKGEYETLTVTIGDGKGHNWWCVLYPGLCFINDSYSVISDEKIEELKKVLTEEEFLSIWNDKEERKKVRIAWKWF